MAVLVLAVVEAGVNLLGHGAEVFDGPEDVDQRAALREIHLAVVTDKAVGLGVVAVIDGVHLGEVKTVSALTHDFVLDERSAGEAPARSGFVLVLDRSSLNSFHISELEALYRVAFGDIRLHESTGVGAQGCHNGSRQHNEMFHI